MIKVTTAITVKATFQKKAKNHCSLPIQHHNATMAGTSGCIPDHQVNLFGQLCKSALPPSAVTASESKPQGEINSSVDNTPVPRRHAIPIPESDPVAMAFDKHKHLIRGFSGGNAKAYLAAVKDVFAEVHRDRVQARVEQSQKQQPARYDPIEQYDEHRAEDQDQCQIKRQEQHRGQHPAQHHYQYQHQPQTRSQSLPDRTAHPASSLMIPQHKTEAKQPRQSRLQHEEDARCCIRCQMNDDEWACDGVLWLDALLMANCTGDLQRSLDSSGSEYGS